MVEKALTAVIQEAYIQRISSRSVDEQSLEPDETVSSTARRHGVAPICFIGGAGS